MVVETTKTIQGFIIIIIYSVPSHLQANWEDWEKGVKSPNPWRHTLGSSPVPRCPDALRACVGLDYSVVALCAVLVQRVRHRCNLIEDMISGLRGGLWE